MSHETEYYALSTENPYFYLWLTVSVVSSCFTYTWDVKLDWGLFDSRAGENKFLREEIVYSSPVSFSSFHELVLTINDVF